MADTARKRDYPFSENASPNHEPGACFIPEDIELSENVKSPSRVSSLYLDYNRDTPLADEVFEAVNNHIVNFKYPIIGDAKNAIEEARKSVATMIAAKCYEIIFTSCSIKSMRIVLKSAEETFHNWFKMEFPDREKVRTHIISTMAEPADNIIFLKKFARDNSIDLTLVPVSKTSGRVSQNDILTAITPFTSLITISHVTPAGTIQPLKDISLCLEELSANAKLYKTLLHSDISNALGKMNVDVKSLKLDCATMSGNTIYAPKISALYFNKDLLQHKTYAETVFREEHLKTKIENVSFVVGLGHAAHLISKNLRNYQEHFSRLKKHFENELSFHMKNEVAILNTGTKICNVSSVVFKNLDAFERLMKKNILCSNIKSARNEGFINMLEENGFPSDLVKQTLIISFGRSTTEDELSNLVKHIKKALK